MNYAYVISFYVRGALNHIYWTNTLLSAVQVRFIEFTNRISFNVNQIK
jgi:hypothetical protein